MFRICLVSLVLFGAACSARADSAVDVVRLATEWKMSLDEHGKVTALTMKPGRATEVLGRILESAIRGWAFEPGAINGEPAATETSLVVGITLSPVDDGERYSARIDNVRTGGSIEKITTMPVFTSNQADRVRKDRVNPLVMLLVTYDVNGRPEEVLVADESPVRKGGLASQAVSAVKTWIFSPERVAGHGIRARALVPVCFVAVVDKNGQGDCKDSRPDGTNSPEMGQSLALSTEVRLKSDVIGRLL